MGTVNFFDADREAPIEAASITHGAADDTGELVLVTFDGTTIDVGNVKGDTGPDGTYVSADEGTWGLTTLATSAEALAGTEDGKVLTPATARAELQLPAMGRVYASGALSLSLSSPVPFDSVDFDTDGLWDATNKRFNVTRKGYYRIRGQVVQSGTAAFGTSLEAGTTANAKRISQSGSSNNVANYGAYVESLALLNVGDYIWLNTGSVTWAMKSSPASNYLEFEFLRPV